MSGAQEWANPTFAQFHAAIDGAMNAIIAQKQGGSLVGGKVCGSLVEIPEVDNLVIVSDLHGDFDCLVKILEAIGYETFLSNPNNKLIFLGDYIDRGSNSVAVLYSVCHLKLAYPDSVVLMRGNHEAPSEFPFSSHDFPFQLVDRFGESDGKTIYRKALALFWELALATMVANRLLLVHGGLPTDVQAFSDYRSLLSLDRNDDLHMRVLEEVLWNDPRQISSTNGWEKSRRGIGRHFGEEITRKWLEMSRAKCIVRGHEPCQGFRIDHNGGILTLFSCHAPYPSFKAAYLSIGKADLQAIRDANGLVAFIRYPLSL